MDEKCVKQIVDMIKLPYEVLELDEDDDAGRVTNLYKESLERGIKEGFWPVLLDVDDMLVRRIKGFYDCGYDPLEVCNQDLAFQDGVDYLRNNCFEYYTFEALLRKEVLAKQSAKRKKMRTELDADSDTVLLLKVPTSNPWEVVAYVPFGGWNECPFPEELIKVCYYWFREYHAMPAVISAEGMEFYLDSPISDDVLLQVMREHCSFATLMDNERNLGFTIQELIYYYRNSTVWEFWWD